MQRRGRGCHSVLLKQFGDALHPGVHPCSSCPSYTEHTRAALVHNVLSSPSSHVKQSPAYNKHLEATLHYFQAHNVTRVAPTHQRTNHLRYTRSSVHQAARVQTILLGAITRQITHFISCWSVFMNVLLASGTAGTTTAGSSA